MPRNKRERDYFLELELRKKLSTYAHATEWMAEEIRHLVSENLNLNRTPGAPSRDLTQQVRFIRESMAAEDYHLTVPQYVLDAIESCPDDR
jgi:hypothetical protein